MAIFEYLLSARHSPDVQGSTKDWITSSFPVELAAWNLNEELGHKHVDSL